jgi:tmRNA-binding protein
LPPASSHVKPDPVRTRKLLLHSRQISKLIGQVERAGYTLVPLDLHFQRGRIKVEIGLAKGKKQHDKRESRKRTRLGPREGAADAGQGLGEFGRQFTLGGQPVTRFQ